MPRIARVVVPQYPHHITQRGTNRSEIFIDTDDHLYFLTLLGEWIKKLKWRWSSAQEHIHGRTDNTITLHKWLRDEEREEYAKIILEATLQEKIRKATSTGRPFGGTKFLDKLEVMLHRNLQPKQGGRPRKKK